MPRKGNTKRPPTETLRDLYFVQNKTQKEIAEICGASHQSVSRWMQELKLEADTTLKGRPQWVRKSPPPKEELSKLYEAEGLSLAEIGRRYETDRNMVSRWMRECGIEIITVREEYNGFFETIDSPEKAYWLGFIQGDGNITRIRRSDRDGYQWRLTVGLEVGDQEHIEKLNLALGYDKSPSISHRTQVHPHSGSPTTLAVRVWSSRNLYEHLSSHGIEERKSSKDVDLDLSKGFELPFIAGLLDSDGSVSVTKSGGGSLDPQMAFLGSAKLVRKVRDFLGVSNKIYMRGDHLAQCVIRGRWVVGDLLSSIYGSSPVHLSRKYERFLEIESYNRENPRKMTT